MVSIELLGSNDEREKFFKEFEMTDHLEELYRSQGRSAELFQLLIEEGQLRRALDVAAASNFQDNIPEYDIEIVFNLLQVEKFFRKTENEPDPLLISRDWKLPPYLLSTSTAWNAISHILSSVKCGEVVGTLAEVQNKIVKECLCIYVSRTFS